MELEWIKMVWDSIADLPPVVAVLFWSLLAVLVWSIVFVASMPGRQPIMTARRPREIRAKTRG